MDLYIEKPTGSYYDIKVDGGALLTTDGGKEEIANRIIVGLSTYVGENYMDVDYGVDYFNSVYGYDVIDVIPQSELRAAITETRGVTELQSFDLVREDRTATLTAKVLTTQGEIDLATTISI